MGPSNRSANRLRTPSASHIAIVIRQFEEQKKLGIDQPGKIGLSGFSAIRGPHEVDPEERASNAIRERCWLEHMLKLDSWPVLFVCGAHHSESFRVLLQANDINVYVLVPNWAPN